MIVDANPAGISGGHVGARFVPVVAVEERDYEEREHDAQEGSDSVAEMDRR